MDTKLDINLYFECLALGGISLFSPHKNMDKTCHHLICLVNNFNGHRTIDIASYVIGDNPTTILFSLDSISNYHSRAYALFKLLSLFLSSIV